MPDRVIYAEAGDETSVLICFEEGLRHGGLGTVVAEVARLSMAASRRLQLAANTELVALRVRVIALEKLVISLLATASNQQLELAHEMAVRISADAYPLGTRA